MKYMWTGVYGPNVIFTRGKVYEEYMEGHVRDDRDCPARVESFPDMVRLDTEFHVGAGAGVGQFYHVEAGEKKVLGPDVADRHNDGKPEMSYVLQGPKGLAGLAKVLEFGGRKYDRGNWLKGFPDTSLIDSMMRHLTAYISGEVLDPESGLPHIDHIHANAKFLAEHGDRDET